MKNKIFKSMVQSVIITTILTIINYQVAIKYLKPLFYLEFSGGEVVTYIGVGVIKDVVYPLSNGPSTTYSHVNFHFVSYVVTLLIVFVVILLINYLVMKKYEKVD